ncbi:MAG: response regulator [Peptococcaceae bacterium]|nr:response regulator [Peptococcaceae bacterium]
MLCKENPPCPEHQHLVLVVDDDAVTRNVIKNELSAWGMRVYGLSCVKETREFLNRIRPDLIILDIVLPDHSGLDLCTELRLDRRFLWVPIFFLTVVSDLDKKMEGYRLGADIYITKPFNPKELAALVRARINRMKELQDQAVRDYVTGLYSRGYFIERLDEEIQDYKRNRRPFCVAIIDLDWFKTVNDQAGHLAGDFVLSRFGGFLRKHLRKVDIIARYGGEEFILLMPDTEAEASRSTLERLRENWLALPLVEPYQQKPLTVTFSAGVAQFNDSFSTPHGIILAADNALYAAKGAGRNRIFLAENLNCAEKLQSPLIMVVDDSTVIRHLLEKHLSEKGYRVVTAKDGQEAFNKAGRQQPSLAVVDIVMPGMDGLELTRKLRENPRTAGIKVIALTADQFEGTLIKAFHAGVDEYINKPFSFPELEAAIQRLLKSKPQSPVSAVPPLL